MRNVIVLIFALLLLNCGGQNRNQEKDTNTLESATKHEDNNSVEIDANTTTTDRCECIDYHFSQKGQEPLLMHNLGSTKIIVCGYIGKYEWGITLGERLPDSSFYVSGFNLFSCTESGIDHLFENGEYYLNKIVPKPNQIEVIRLRRMPVSKKLDYDWTEIISIKIHKVNQQIKVDSSFVLSVDLYDQEFIDYFKSEISKLENDPTIDQTNYLEYLIDYSFIQAVINPKEYGQILHGLGPFDGYLGPLYRDILMYYKIFENKKYDG